MYVADFTAAGAMDLAGGAVLAFDQPRIRSEFLDALEAGDVMDLIHDYKSKDLADAGNGTQKVECLGVVDFGVTGNV